jgi:hypothetical protein
MREKYQEQGCINDPENYHQREGKPTNIARNPKILNRMMHAVFSLIFPLESKSLILIKTGFFIRLFAYFYSIQPGVVSCSSSLALFFVSFALRRLSAIPAVEITPRMKPTSCNIYIKNDRRMLFSKRPKTSIKGKANPSTTQAAPIQKSL